MTAGPRPVRDEPRDLTGGRGAGVRRVVPGLTLLLCLLIVAALWSGGAHDAYFELFRLLGVPAFQFPFLDTHAELAVIECHRRGIDVYLSNPCDVLGRIHVYTPLWFRFEALPIDTNWTPALGFALALAFAASLALLPPGRDARGTALICAAALSPAVGFAVERGNADLLMFILAALAAATALCRLPTRLLAFPMVLLAAGLKVYPAALLLLVVRERLVLAGVIATLSLAALGAYAVTDAAGLREMLAVVPGGSPFLYSFGAKNLPTGLGVALGWPPLALAGVQAALLLAVIGVAAARLELLGAAVRGLAAAETVALLAGAVLMLGCFVMGQSAEYRAVYLLFVLPALAALAGTPGPARRVAAATLWVILLQLWGDVASAPLDRLGGVAAGGIGGVAALLLWLARELAWWWIVAMLLALLLAVLRDQPCVAMLHRRPAAQHRPAAKTSSR